MTALRGEAPVPAGVIDPRDLPAAFMSAFNRGDFVAMSRLFDEDAVRVVSPGRVLRGDERAEPTRAFYRQGYRITLEVTQCIVADDVAQLLVSHRTENIHDRSHIRYGTALDVARRDPTGGWRYLIDNPNAVGL